ncbi:MAG: hypothetical protein Pars2KO_07780 [Parasphingorhabdus sp.]
MKRFLVILLLIVGGWIGYGYLSEAMVDRSDLELPLAPQATTGVRPLSEIALPPRNPMAAEGVNPMPHGEPAQQDSTILPGPLDTSRQLESDELTFVHLGPGHFGAFNSSEYPDGRRLLWSNGVNGLYKLDYETYEIYDHLPSDKADEFTQEWAEELTAELDENNGTTALYTAYKALTPLMSLSGIYTVVGRNGWIYIAKKDGSIVAYGDSIKDEPTSKIELKAKFQLPDELAGASVGMNMTFDGWIVFPMEKGHLIAVSEDLKQHRSIRLKHASTEDTSTQNVGYGWVRNSIALDKDGGIYVASRNHMHKVIWNGDQFSTDEKDGAWTAKYRNGTGEGTGATPSLMGFGDEDKFVVITDGDIRMNVTLFWRDDIPNGWKTLEGAPSNRIAGLAPASMGALNVQKIQSEQTVIVAGYGALVVNNRPRNIPFFFPKDGNSLGLLNGPLGGNPKFQPYGVQKFQWNPAKQRIETAWVNEEMSSPNGVPWVSLGSGQVYLMGARDNKWTLEAIDWATGESTFYYVIGGQKWNSTYSGPTIDENGRVFYGTMWGRARIQPNLTENQNSNSDAVEAM